jgi:membrane glycosyltransferase
MNALVRTLDLHRTGRSPGAADVTDLPREAALAMPIQSFRDSPPALRMLRRSPAAVRLSGLIAATIVITALALAPVCRLLAADTLGPIDLVIILLVALLFAWSAFAFLSALAGFVAGRGHTVCELGIAADGPLPGVSSRNAMLLPVYNEAVLPVFARLQAICESVTAAGGTSHFDYFILSDSTDKAVLEREYALFTRLKHRLGESARVFYRHRPKNTGRKAGNIAEWVRRFGGAYDHMVVLDADSLMEGATLMRLAAAMEREVDVGLIQTAPAIVNRHTLFARAEQFASRLYGPMLARGVAWWSGSVGNYWGHNAIIRVRAFAEQAGLPQIKGRKPFGGHILSHDFVEAALLRRAGWRVCMAPNLGGSYEESPPTLAALLARDRRWCQGNLQHVPVLWARGLHWISRFHLLRGVSAYLAAPLWLALLVCAALLPLHPEWGVRAGSPVRAMAGVRLIDLLMVAVVLMVSIGFLLAPKIMALVEVLVTPGERTRFGGGRLATLNVILEIVLSTLIAPLIMISHAKSFFAALAGRDSGWTAQAREETGTNLKRSARLHAGDMAVGMALAAAAVGSSAHDLLWMAPVIAGLTLAIPLATLLASARLGRAARRAGLLLAPEERHPPQILARANALSAGWPPI